MKVLYISSKINSKINENKIRSLKLPKNIAIAYSIQYKNIAEKIKEILSERHNITGMIQVLGCSKPKFSKNTQVVLLITSGRFHAVSLALETKLPVYILESDKLREISREEISSFEKRKHVSYMNFLNSDTVGILISTKPGQENMKEALLLKDKLGNKRSYLFLGNEIDTRQFENFNINAWINTACPRLDFEGFVFNIEDLNFRQSKDGF